jgi:hypothetical protein
VKISCPSCQKALSIDETKLPMKEVQFPCPSCKAKITFDRRAAAEAPSVLAQHDDEDEFTAKALIVGTDSPAARQAAKAIGFTPVFVGSPEASRDFYLQEYPPLVFFCPQQLTQPPLQELVPLTSVAPSDRRRAFYILVADGVRSLDGNAAFLFNVNLVVASKDLGSLPQVYRDARAFHDRLYQHLQRALA